MTISDQWAVEFLHLEKLYHERLLSNLASIQEKWGKNADYGWYIFKKNNNNFLK